MNSASTRVCAVLGAATLLALSACTSKISNESTEAKTTIASPRADQPKPLFTLLTPEQSGVDFSNQLGENEIVNPYRYVNAFNGGGVAIGDLNNDGYQDIYFSSNTRQNRLYVSQGILEYKDITELAGVDGGQGWCSGVTMADVNGDNLLDIYVCKAFTVKDAKQRTNLLYLNNGDLTFTESAAQMGIADTCLSVQSTFFDYDNDGDLDLFVANHPWDYSLSYEFNLQKQRNPEHRDSDHLYRNNGDGTFTDVTIKAGLVNFGFTLGLIASDFDKDGYVDIYLANDHAGPDRFYRNNGNGTFTNIVDDAMGHTCNFSMGVDMADFDNDGWVDLANVDMLAADNFRQKTQMSGMNPEAFWRSVDAGYHYQYMRNMLQVNNGNGTFSEVGQMAGIWHTDWSWAALFADYDNDGLKDLFVTNGYRLDSRDNDFIKYRDAEMKKREEQGLPRLSEQEWGNKMKQTVGSTPLANYLFLNNGDYTFDSKANENGVGKPGFSNGAAYADLDNDGDLDLVVNNIDDVAHIYRSNAAELDHNKVRIRLIGKGLNTQALGAKVTVTAGDLLQYQELTRTRGFQSSVENILHFGLAEHNAIDEVSIVWPDGSTTVATNQSANGLLTFKWSDSTPAGHTPEPKPETLMADVSSSVGIRFTHTENEFDDYEDEVLLPHRMSRFGPSIAAGDVNGDGYEDFYVGGAARQAGALYLGNASGKFRGATGAWAADKACEDLGALFFDADSDGDQDLYVVSGGTACGADSPLLQDRLYLNDGSGNFTKSVGLPEMITSGSCVSAGDMDGDGDLDLFVGGRVVPGLYPTAPRSYVLQNDAGTFTDITATVAPDLVNAGLVTAAEWTDFDGDGTTDLVVAGEWMPICLYANNGGSFTKTALPSTEGWWFSLAVADFDSDGDMDVMAGNLGLNYKYQATVQEPFQVYSTDFDQNGHNDIVLGYFNDGTCFPVRGRQCSSEQIPDLKKKFPSYNAFAKASLQEVYGEKLNDALHLQAKTMASTYFENKGKGVFEGRVLPPRAQFAPINGIIPYDFNDDGNLDVLVAGNLFVSEVETGRADAGVGLLLAGDGKGGFTSVTHHETGFFARGDVKDIQLVGGNTAQPMVLVANNNAAVQAFKVTGKQVEVSER